MPDSTVQKILSFDLFGGLGPNLNIAEFKAVGPMRDFFFTAYMEYHRIL